MSQTSPIPFSKKKLTKSNSGFIDARAVYFSFIFLGDWATYLVDYLLCILLVWNIFLDFMQGGLDSEPTRR